MPTPINFPTFNVSDTESNGYQLSVIPFNQGNDLICNLDPNKHKTLSQYNKRFHGLCDFVCNRILIDNSLGEGKDINYIKNRVTVERVNEEIVKKSHILTVYSIFHRIIAYLFGIYPDNIFSYSDQRKLIDNTGFVNSQLLHHGLDTITEGETLKLEVFSRGCLSLEGHSMLIKKMANDKYIFFDPNVGEYRDVSFDELINRINTQIHFLQGTDIFLMRGKDYLKRLQGKIGRV